MTTALPEDQRLLNLSAKAYEHPADRAATAALQSIPMLDTVVRKLIEYGYERALRQQFLAGSIKLGEEQLPADMGGLERGLRAPGPAGAVRPLPDAVPDHERGRDRRRHADGRRELALRRPVRRPRDAHRARARGGPHPLRPRALPHGADDPAAALFSSLPLGAGLPLMAVQLALLEWFRAAELSCDRAATLVNRDPLVTCRTLMVMAGGASSRKLNLNAFIHQATEYEDWDSGWDKLNRMRAS